VLLLLGLVLLLLGLVLLLELMLLVLSADVRVPLGGEGLWLLRSSLDFDITHRCYWNLYRRQ